ncbi:hypothetical protein N0V94_001144 [Neodidymelliopsis sp. IMI 364377]|nr:hypothetical protein N0V94_001144 [Neodidymelliopsis sp. IMI 364377]
MRLLEIKPDGKLSLTKDLIGDDDIPAYAILSHTWQDDQEVTFDEMINGTGKDKAGHHKIHFCAEQAKRDGLHYFWVDTCCINKADAVELQDAINSMFRWYRNSATCYVFLSDVSTAKRKAGTDTSQITWKPAFRTSRWFTRGWTLQELLAPRTVKFFSREGNHLGYLNDLKQMVQDITQLPITALTGTSLSKFGFEERLSWSDQRTTTRKEDKAYSLLGIFGIHMPLIYGEGEVNAFRRLRREIEEQKYATPGTCDWLFKDQKYQIWRNSSRGLFWIKGNPGVGKSVLMKHAAKIEKQRRPDELVVSYFVHGQGTELQKAPLGVLRALLNSLLGHFPSHLAKLTATFRDREERFGGYMANRWHWSCKELQELLLSVLVEGTQHQHVVIFVDALDECGEDSAKNLLAYFSGISRQVDAKGAHVKICLSSRHYPILSLENFPAISVEERNGEDIRWYVGERLRGIQPATRRQQIQDEILSKACGGFQWVFLITETLIGRHLAGKNLFKDIASCPQTLSELYATILNTGPEMERSQMIKLFQWILFAKRPLSAQELRDALAADADMSCTSVVELRSQESWSETLVDFERYVKYISRGLVEFHSREIWEQYEPGGEDSDREAQLIHQSVADYLLDKHLSKIDINQDGAAHIQISKSCFKYLALDEVLKGSRLSRGVLSSRYPLAPYGTRYVFRHILEAERSGNVQLNFLSLINWTPRSETVSKLAELWHILDPDNVHTPEGWPFLGSTELHVLAACGLESAFTDCLENLVGDVDSRDTEGNTPLHLAIREGHQNIAMALLDQSYELQQQQGPTNNDIVAESQIERQYQGRRIGINAQNNEGETALDIAVLEKADATIDRLIKAGADLKFMGRDDLLVFSAISSGNLGLLTLLIERGVSLDGAVFFAMLDYTRKPDHVLQLIIETLLKFGATTNKPTIGGSWFSSHFGDDGEEFDENMRSDDDALHLATRFGSLPMVDLMISHGVAASVQNGLGECSLLIAVQNGHFHLVQRFLQLDPAAVEANDKFGVTALDAAWGDNRLDLVEILLDKGLFEYPSPALNSFLLWLAQSDTLKFIDVTPGRRCDQIILSAEKRGTVFRLSLDLAAVNINERDVHGRSILWHAASKAHHTLVNMLLSTGKVDLNAKDDYGCSPLWAAGTRGHATVFRLLLDTKQVSPHGWAGSSISELWLLKTEGHEAIIKTLLDVVDINMKDESGTPPLLNAVARQDMLMVQMLLNTGRVDVNCTDKKGYTPLARAAEYGYVDIAKLLLEVGKADVNGKQIGRLTPLYLATQVGHKPLIELLRAHGAVAWEDEATPTVAPADAYPIVSRPRSMIAAFLP